MTEEQKGKESPVQTPTREPDVHDLLEAACCIWEEMIDQFRRAQGEKFAHFPGGFASARSWAYNQAETVHMAWEIAQLAGFNDAFDWEFVPAFLERAYDDKWQLRPNWREIAREIGGEA